MGAGQEKEVMRSERRRGVQGRLAAEPALIISNNRDSAVLEFGRLRGVPSVWIGGAAYEDQALRDEAICTELSIRDVDVVLLLDTCENSDRRRSGAFETASSTFILICRSLT
jgi:hypothetical protein